MVENGLRKSQGDWVSVPSRGFCALGKDDLRKSQGDRVSVPSRAFCFLSKDDLRKSVRQIGHLARTVAPRNFQPQAVWPDRPDSRQIGLARLAPSWRQIGRSARTGKSARLTPPERRQIDNSLPVKRNSKNNALATSKRQLLVLAAAFSWGTPRFEQKLQGILKTIPWRFQNNHFWL